MSDVTKRSRSQFLVPVRWTLLALVQIAAPVSMLAQPEVESLATGTKVFEPARRARVLRTESVPPAKLLEGDRFLIGPHAGGAFRGHSDEIAHWDGGSWLFALPELGDEAYDMGAGASYIYTGTPSVFDGVWPTSKWRFSTAVRSRWKTGAAIVSDRALGVEDHGHRFFVAEPVEIRLPSPTLNDLAGAGIELLLEISDSTTGFVSLMIEGGGIFRDSDGSEHLNGRLMVEMGVLARTDILRLTAGDTASAATWYIERPHGPAF